ncbi:unnamed protein product [Sphenostylis stenocarpa]|uniref:Uncharacterized protein n=1 Tax=Sphenostylis stenocarpa TaxID=92480 RepID=A0AA86T1H2_9FABA|nr:unnamed protein product [Sphenostylis stenocarpa]
MDPNPGTFPLLSYVMSRLPSLTPRLAVAATATTSDSDQFDVEQPRTPEIVGQMPHLADPDLMASMGRAVSQVAQARSVLNLIGERPTHEEVDSARARLAEIEAQLSRDLEEIVLQARPAEMEIHGWRAHQAEKERECRERAETEKQIWKSVLQLDEMHEAYEKLLKEAERRLVKMYESKEDGDGDGVIDEVNEEVVGILQEAYGKGMERVNLSGRQLKLLPEAFGRIPGLLVLDLSSNQLSEIPDAIAGLQNLEELNLSSNLLESLPDSIGLLQKLKLLNVSGNKLTALPDPICHCR